MSVTFTPKGADRIRRAVAKGLRDDRVGERTGAAKTETSFWALLTGPTIDGNRYNFVRVYPTAANDSEADFFIRNGPAYRLVDAEPEQGLAREANGCKSVPTYTVVRCDWLGYDRDDKPNYLFQYIGPQDTIYLPPHDHRSNDQGGFAFACYHPGTAIPQQPWVM